MEVQMKTFLRLTAAFAISVAVAACAQGGGQKRVDRVEPGEGIASGGDQVTIKGGGFQPGKTQVEIRFGRHKAEQVVIASENRINVITPAGDKGPVDVTLSFDDGSSFKIASGFRYVAPQTDDVRKAFFSGKAAESAAKAK
jgi:hypothetical protein